MKRQGQFLTLFPLALTLIIPVGTAACNRNVPGQSAGVTRVWPWTTAQDDDSGEAGSEVKPEDVEKYINVYQAMQHNRSLTVEQAAAGQNLTVAQFRDIESHIERDGVLRERVRRALLKSARQRTQDLGLHQARPASTSTP